MNITQPAEWDALAAGSPGAHILQSWAWGEFKRRYGWTAQRLAWPGAAAQILRRRPLPRLPYPSILYAPKGPLLDWSDPALVGRTLDELQALARRAGALFIKIDPDWPLSAGLPGAEIPHPAGLAAQAELRRRGWRFSADQVQFRNTVKLDLRGSEDDLLAAMKPKTRYNIRLAERKGVRVRSGGPGDVDLLYRMYAETSVRDGFVIRQPGYYHDAWGRFLQAGLAQALVAEVDDQPVSALILFAFGGTAWYMYGMSREAQRDKMPNHRLQWEAIRWAKARGCHTYDFWGAPDEFVESDPLWGVWKFKEGFGGQIVRHLGAWDYAPWPRLYTLYTQIMPRLLDRLRRRGQAQTRQSLGSSAAPEK